MFAKSITMNQKLTPLQQEIFDGYMSYFKAYTSRNWNAMVGSFHPEISVIGTGIDEVKSSLAEVLDFFRREFEQAPDWVSYKINSYTVTVIDNQTGAITLICDMVFKTSEKEFLIPDNRTTAIMRKTESGWKLFHAHWSQPAPGQEEGHSIPYKKLQEENLHLEQLVKARTRQLEEQTRKLEKLNQTKDQIFSIISHDLRAPFNSILGLSEIMLLTFEKNFTNREYFFHRLSLINQQLNSLYILVDNLLSWAKAQTGELRVEFTECSLFSIINNQTSVLRQNIEEKNLKINQIFDKQVTFFSDYDIVSIIIRNFLTNAIKYSFNEGEIIVKAEQLEQKLVISVIDFGIGIEKNVIQQILDENQPTFSTPGTNKEKGSGLGLKLCLQLAAFINAKINIESSKTTGTNLSLSLPRTGNQ